MPMLQAPDGTRYATDDEAEIRNLTLGHGYRVLSDGNPEHNPEPDKDTDKGTGEGQDDEDDLPV